MDDTITETSELKACQHSVSATQSGNTLKNAQFNKTTLKKGEETQSLHGEFILNGLQVLKSNNILCDVVLMAESEKIYTG